MARKRAVSRLEQARADHAEAERKISKLEAARADALLADRDADAARLDAELETLRRLARGFRDKISLLEAEAEREENDRRVREREGLIRRLEIRLAERDETGRELQAKIGECEALFRRMIQLSEEVACAWAWSTADFAAA